MADNPGWDMISSSGIGESSEERRLLQQGKPSYDDDDDDDDSESHTGYGITTASIFVVAAVAGTGVLVLPNALAKTGWSGLIVLLTVCVIQIYTGVLLGRCWSILQERFEIYRRQTRNPYPAIGYEAFGAIGRILVTLTIDVSVIGICVVFLLIISENATILFGLDDFPYCYKLAITAALLCPFTWFGTPKDFWFIGLAGALSTGFACILLLIKMFRDLPTVIDDNVNYTGQDYVSYFSGVGIMIVAFNGHMSFPTIQHDMAEPSKFPSSLILAGIIVAFYFLPMAIVGFYVYGDVLYQEENIFDVVGGGFEPTVALVLITLHVITAFVILGNPVFQDVEDILGIEMTFTWKRIVVRSSFVILMWFLAATIPSFAHILSFLGGTSFLALAFIYPVCCYCKLMLTGCPTKSWISESFSVSEVIIFATILILGIIIAASTTYADFSLVGSELYLNFSRPCYLPIITGH